MRRAPHTNAARTPDSDTPSTPLGLARTKRTAAITLLHQLRARAPAAPKATLHATCCKVQLEQYYAALLFSILRHTPVRAARTADAHTLHALRPRLIARELPAATDGALLVALLPASASITQP